MCNANWRATGIGEPNQGDPVWCSICAIKIRRTPGDLDTLAALLEHRNDGYGETTDNHGRTTHTHAPSPSPRFDTLDEIERMLAEWETAYRDVKGWPSAPRRGRYATVTTETVAWLTRHMDGILGSPFALEFGEECLRAARHLVDAEKAGLGHKRGRVPCPRCQQLGLFSIDDGFVYICTFCNKPVPRDEYHELCGLATPKRAS